MKALVKYEAGPGRMEIREVPEPVPARDEVLVRVEAVGVCGTDLKIYDDHFPYNAPVIVGHEFSGIVEKTGPDAEGFAAGDRVVSEQHTRACGLCRYCLTGKRHLCASKKAPGYGIDGAYAKYIAVPANLLHRIPEGVPFEEAALIEPMAVAACGILGKARIEPEDTVVILGCGPIALLALQMVKAAGASGVFMTGIDADEKTHFGIAKTFGADMLINVMKVDPVKQVLAHTRGVGADVVIDLSGAPQAILQGFDMLRKDGRFLALGLPAADVAVPWQKLVLKAANIIFSYSSDYLSWERCLAMIREGKIKLEKFTQDVFLLAEWEKAFALARSGEALKAIIRP